MSSLLSGLDGGEMPVNAEPNFDPPNLSFIPECPSTSKNNRSVNMIVSTLFDLSVTKTLIATNAKNKGYAYKDLFRSTEDAFDEPFNICILPLLKNKCRTLLEQCDSEIVAFIYQFVSSENLYP